MSCILDNDHSGLRIVGGARQRRVTFYEAGLRRLPGRDRPTGSSPEGGDGDDTLIGGDADETLAGGAGADRVTGRGGNDTIDGGDGNDTLSGDADDQYSDLTAGGNDVIPAARRRPARRRRLGPDAAIGQDVLDGGPGVDTVTSGWYRFDGHGGDEDPPPSITLDGMANDGRPGENDNVVGVEHVSTGYQPATSRAGRIHRQRRPDEINLLFANGIVSGAAGDDRITGSDAADILDGGAGNDQISGGFGDDTITGGPGTDNLGGDRTAACFYGPIYGAARSARERHHLRPGRRARHRRLRPRRRTPHTSTPATSRRAARRCTSRAGRSAAAAVEVAAPARRCRRRRRPRSPHRRSRIGHQRLRTIAKKRKIRLRCRLTQAGRCSIRASITAKDARKLHLKVKRHAHSFTLGSRTVKLKRAGTATVVVRISRRTASRLRHARSLRLTLTATARYATGTRRLTKHPRVKR